MTPEKVNEQVVQIVKRHQPARHYKLFLFGSRATGNAVNRSDYDFGIEATEKIPFDKYLEIKSEMENIRILQKVDFVDFSRVSEDFKEVAMESIKVLYEQ